MKTIAVMLAVLLLVAGVAFAKEYEVSKKAGDLNVVIKIDKNPPVAGENNVAITVTDGSGKAITDAKVGLSYSMPAMAGMPPMNYKADAQPDGKGYKTKVNYSMAGPWNNEIKITHGDKTVSARFTVDAK
jgi:hypothetical protein